MGNKCYSAKFMMSFCYLCSHMTVKKEEEKKKKDMSLNDAKPLW